MSAGDDGTSSGSPPRQSGVRRLVTKLRAIVGLSLITTVRTPSGSALAVCGVALAVLTVTLLAGTGVGVVETGERQFDAADRDLWVSGGPATFTAQGGGGFDNAISDSHALSAEIADHDGVRSAVPIGFQTVYVGADADAEFQTVIATGTSGGGGAVRITEGEGLSGDTHYADGAYDGPLTNEVVLDDQTASALNVSVGDSVNLGGTLSDARADEYEVVGISPTFSQFLGAPTVTLHLSELQRTTGTTGDDPATFIVVTIDDDGDLETVSSELGAQYPEYEVRTNEEQLQAVLETQLHLLAGGAMLVVLALAGGLALTTNVLSLLVHQQRRELAALRAVGIPTTTLVSIVAGKGLLVGVIGGGIGVLLTSPLAGLLDLLAVTVVGYEGLVQTPDWTLALGFSIAVVIGVCSAAVAARRVVSIPPLEEL